MQNTGKGETSTIEQAKVDEPVEITDRNDLNKLNNMSNGSKLRIIPIDAPLYKNIKGYWTPMTDEKDPNKQIKLQKGDIVTYKGEYETFKNVVTDETIAYLKVTTGDEKEGYVKLSTVELVLNNNDNTKTGKITNQNLKSNVTSRAKVSGKTIGQDKETYVVAIAAGRNNEDEKGIVNQEKNLKEEELTIKVAEKVKELLSGYTNIKVVQTGSTSNNPGGIKNKDRAQLARDVNPNLCIQIYFGDGNDVGVETIYKEGDDISQQLAEILAKNMSSSMGLENLGAGADTTKCKDADGESASLSIIDNAAATGFPSVVAMGGNLTKDPDASVIAGDGVNKYAQAIVNSIDEYFKADHSGRTSTEDVSTTYKDSTESRIINMKYVSPEKLQKYVDGGDFENALKSYTIDDEKNLVIVTWSRGEDGSIELRTNNSMNLKTALKKFVMPYEYLLFFYIDTDYEKFVDDLEEEVMKTEIVMAVQDNISTSNTVETTKQKKEADVDKFNEDWHETSKKTTLTENVSTTVNVTYVQNWCVKAYQENSYSEAVLQLGDEEEKIIDVPGKVTESTSNSSTAEEVVNSGSETYNEIETDANGNSTQIQKSYNYKIYEQKLSNIHTISNSYERGEYKTEGRESVFVELYNKHNMIMKVRTSDYLFKIIENNERTADLLDLTKYLIYKATNIPWGVLEFDFSIFDLEQFNSISMGGLDAFIRYLNKMEGSFGESPDGTKYVIGVDTNAGSLALAHGIDLTYGGYRKRFEDAGYKIRAGEYVDKEFVDGIVKEIVLKDLDDVNKLGLDLTQYQKYALVSRMFNCGYSGALLFSRGGNKNFVEAYNRYWDQEKDDEYKVTENEGMYKHKLYETYMYKPFTAQGSNEPVDGLVTRRRSEWILFKTGYYTYTGEWCSDSYGGNIVEAAATVHNYVSSNGYYYTQGKTLPSSVKNARNTKGICCATFVAWTLYEAGYDWMEECPNINACSSLLPFLIKNGGNKIMNPTLDKLQPGDIVFYGSGGSAHTDIYIGDGEWYNCGSDTSVKLKEPQRKGLNSSRNKPYCIIRFN